MVLNHFFRHLRQCTPVKSYKKKFDCQKLCLMMEKCIFANDGTLGFKDLIEPYFKFCDFDKTLVLSNMVLWIFLWIFSWIYPRISACCSLKPWLLPTMQMKISKDSYTTCFCQSINEKFSSFLKILSIRYAVT